MTRPTRSPSDEPPPTRLQPRKHTDRRRSILAAVAGIVCWIAPGFMLGGCGIGPTMPADSPHRTDTASSVDTHLLIRKAADHEALFTLAGGLKPMSSGFWRGSFEVDDPDLDEIIEVRQALAVLRNDAWHADIQVFAKAHDGRSSAHAFVVHRAALARMIRRHESFWSPWGITPDTHPNEIVAVVDRMPRSDRWRGHGYLYGYPDDAVDFFVEAGLAADDGREVGPEKDREFIDRPTHAAESGHFTYAVPLGHVPTMTDRMLADHAELILEAYTRRRPRMVDAPSTIAELLRLNSRFEPLADQGSVAASSSAMTLSPLNLSFFRP